jgi:hypothetical protein
MYRVPSEAVGITRNKGPCEVEVQVGPILVMSVVEGVTWHKNQ